MARTAVRSSRRIECPVCGNEAYFVKVDDSGRRSISLCCKSERGCGRVFDVVELFDPATDAEV